MARRRMQRSRGHRSDDRKGLRETEKWTEKDEERAKNTARGVWQCDKRDAENSNGVGSPVYS